VGGLRLALPFEAPGFERAAARAEAMNLRTSLIASM